VGGRGFWKIKKKGVDRGLIVVKQKQTVVGRHLNLAQTLFDGGRCTRADKAGLRRRSEGEKNSGSVYLLEKRKYPYGRSQLERNQNTVGRRRKETLEAWFPKEIKQRSDKRGEKSYSLKNRDGGRRYSTEGKDRKDKQALQPAAGKGKRGKIVYRRRNLLGPGRNPLQAQERSK